MSLYYITYICPVSYTHLDVYKRQAHNLYIHTIDYNRATSDYNIGLLHTIISDAKITNLGNTYKGEVDYL